MINTDKLPVIIDKKAIEEQNIELKNLQNKQKKYNKALKGIEEFLTYIYNNSRTFRDLKEKFNENSEYCRIRLQDNKIKIEVYEKD